MAYNKERGGYEEKAHQSTSRSQQEVDKSSRPTYGSSSRYAQTSDSHRYKDTTRARDKSRSPYRARRDRSRSPYRAPKTSNGVKTQHEGGNGVKRRYEEDHYNNASDSRRLKAHYQEDDRRKPAHGQGKYPASSRGRSRSPFRRDRVPGEQQKALSVSMSEVKEYVQPDINVASSLHQHSDEPEEDPPQLSEAELIEQRRKKREAIKAKHKAAPLLVQALEQNAVSAPNTPIHESNNVQSRKSSSTFHCQQPANPRPATSIDSPQTPAMSSPGSPMPLSPSFSGNIENVLTRTGAVDDDGPAAADYDPSMDRQENRRVEATQQQDSHRAEAAHQQDSHRAEVTQQQAQEVNITVETTELDMFADDDDMFADGPVKDTANITHQAKTLDQSLLDNWDYPDGHYRIIIGELLDGKYAVQQQVGKGTFATVVRAQDTSSGRTVAIKIACNNDTMYKAGTKEMDFLTVLNQTDPEDKRHIIQLLGHFDHKGHLCLVFESLNADLRETLKKYGRNVGLSLIALRAFSHQMFQALSHMKRNEILHADLKPDNILVNDKLNVIKICDLGTAAKIDDAEITPYLVSRFYRAPEVMLGMPIDYAIDMWSIGCTLFELYTGRILFAGSDNNQMLRAIQECRGKIPNRMLKKSTMADHHFDQHFNFISVERDKITGQTSLRQLNLIKVPPGKDLRSRILASAKDTEPAFLKELQLFAELVDKCLQLDPTRRISPSDALKHEFITRITADGAERTKKLVTLAPSRVK